MTTHMATAGIMAAALLLAPSSGFAQNASSEPLAAPAPRPLARLYWVRRPSNDQIENFYPKAALRKNIKGEAEIVCAVQDDGRLTGCKVVSETPKRHGFGAAAVKGSRYFQMRGQTSDNRPIGGGVVRLTIPFRCNTQAGKRLCDYPGADVENFTPAP
jgi:protein TonB